MARFTTEILPKERQEHIMALLKLHGRVVASDLAANFGVSEDSIRRDLREMAVLGLCRRIYGGALLPTANFPPLAERVAQPNESRASLAGYAASLVNPGDVVLLDAGSTNVEIARTLRDKPVTIVTNAPAVADALSGSQIELVMIGGRIDPRCGGAVGSQALQQILAMQANICFPGTCAVDPDSGAWGLNSEEAAFKQAMTQISDRTVIVATDEKIGTRGVYKIVGFDHIDHLVVTEHIPEAVLKRLATIPSRIHRV